MAPDFNLSMHCEKQLQAIKALKEENRILHLDSSGKYCKITREMNDQYQQLMNYVFLLKDVSDFEKPAIIINEVITSRQDTCRIAEMFLLLKHNYRKLFDTTLVFRLIVLDLSWASIHAILEIFNLETVEQYYESEPEQCVSSARDIWRTRRNKREINKKGEKTGSLIKIGAKKTKAKKSVWSFQKAQATLQSLSKLAQQKKLSPLPPPMQSPTQSPTHSPAQPPTQPLAQSPTQSPTRPQADLILIETNSSTEIQTKKWFCYLRSSQFNSTNAFSQHKGTKKHLKNQ